MEIKVGQEYIHKSKKILIRIMFRYKSGVFWETDIWDAKNVRSEGELAHFPLSGKEIKEYYDLIDLKYKLKKYWKNK